MGEVVEGGFIHQFAQRFSSTLIVCCYCLTPSSSCLKRKREEVFGRFTSLPLRGPAWPSNPGRLLSSVYSISRSPPGLQNHADWKLGGSAWLLDTQPCVRRLPLNAQGASLPPSALPPTQGSWPAHGNEPTGAKCISGTHFPSLW